MTEARFWPEVRKLDLIREELSQRLGQKPHTTPVCTESTVKDRWLFREKSLKNPAVLYPALDNIQNFSRCFHAAVYFGNSLYVLTAAPDDSRP